MRRGMDELSALTRNPAYGVARIACEDALHVRRWIVLLPLEFRIDLFPDASGRASPPRQRKRKPAESRRTPNGLPSPSRPPWRCEHYRSGNVLWVVSQAIALAIPAMVLATGLSVRIRNLARRIGRKWFFIVLVYFALY